MAATAKKLWLNAQQLGEMNEIRHFVEVVTGNLQQRFIYNLLRGRGFQTPGPCL